MAEQTKKRLMTTDTTSKISEIPNKMKQIRQIKAKKGKQPSPRTQTSDKTDLNFKENFAHFI